MAKQGTLPIRVLICDKEDLFRAGLRMLFEEQADIESVGELAGGQGVREMAECSAADVLLLDLSLPGRAALDVMRNLDQAHWAGRTIVMTVPGEARDLSKTLQLGARAAVDKKGPTVNLMNAIRRVHEGMRWLDPSLRAELAAPPRLRRGRMSGWSIRSATADPLDWNHLTSREREVAALVAQGRRYKEVARQLRISEHTLKNHLRHIYDKLHIKTRVQLALFGAKNGL